jgi:hypothetical protein
MRGNQNVHGLGPKPIVVVLHRHAEWGKISGHRRESKQVALSEPETAFGRTSDENVIEPCRAFSYRCPVDRVAERHGRLANRDRPHQPASQHHHPGAEAGGEAGGKTTEAGAAGGKHGCSSPNIASRSIAIDNCPKADARFSNGEDRRTREDLQQLHGRLPNKIQIRQSTVERMLGVGWVILDNVQKRTQLQNIPGVQGVRNVFGLETLGDLVVLQQPARRRQAFRREASDRRSQAIRTSLVHTGADIEPRNLTSDRQPSRSGRAIVRR